MTASILDDPATDEQATDTRARNAKRREADSIIEVLRVQGADLVDRANRTTDTELAVEKATAASDLFAHLDQFDQAVDDALDNAADPDAVDLDTLHEALVRQRPQNFIVGTPYVPTPPIHTWTCGDTLTELRKGKPRVLPMLRPVPSGGEGSWSDYFAGAGGSTSGIVRVPGAFVKIAVNHWPLAIETHNFNHQNTDHDSASLARTDPSRYPTTDYAWFSPECTYWSVARGDKCDYDMESEQLALDLMDDDESLTTPEAKEEKWRSRMLMRDVVRFADHHNYKAIIVENVPDILKWSAMDRWLADMVKRGYRYKIITLNSAFAGATGQPAPQLRDRVFIVFWKACYKTPNWDKWLRPKCFCPGCGEVVRGIYNPKPGPRRAMRYGPKAQYTYRCPSKKCAGQMVQPLIMPAGAAIDWSLPTQRIGGRKRPLAAKTLARVRAGLDRYFTCPTLTPVGGSRNDTAYPITSAMRTQTTTESQALVVPLEGRGEVSSIRRLDQPFRTQSTRHQDGLLGIPESMIVPLRNNGNAEPTTMPYRTFAANGNHHALVMRNNTGGAEMCTPVDEPIRTLTTGGHQSLIGHPDQALYSYDTGKLRPLSMPMPSQTTVAGDALLGGGRFIDVDDCTLRMLAVHEVQAGMAFAEDYTLLGKVKRWKIRMLGNAVTPPSSRDLTACVMEAVTGVDIPLYDDSPELWLAN